jgi:hypothetical protein
MGTKISNLTATTASRHDDIVPMVDLLATPTTKKSTIGNLIQNATGYFNIEKYGAVGDSTTNNAVAIQAAVDAASAAGGGTVVIPEGTFKTNTAIAPKSKVNFLGLGQNSLLTASAGNSLIAFPSGGANEFFMHNLRLTASSGHIFDLTAGGCTQLNLNRVWMYQASSDKALWYNNASGNGTLHLLVEDCNLYVDGASRSVPAWYMKDNEGFGNTNANRFINNLCTYGEECNDEYFFHLEAAIDGDYIYDNVFIGNTFELVLGGCFDLRSTFGTILEGNKLWPEGGVVAQAMVSMSKSAATGALNPTNNVIRDTYRLGGSLDTGIVDILLTGNCRSTKIENFRCSPDGGKIDLGSSSLVELSLISPGTTITNKSASTYFQKQGYVLHAEAGQMSPADADLRYIGGNFAVNAGTTADRQRIYIPKDGTITAAYVQFHNSSVLGSNETSTIAIRLNNTTDTTISAAVTNDAVITAVNKTDLAISVSQGDYIELKWTCPTWATNPTNVRVTASILVE